MTQHVNIGLVLFEFDNEHYHSLQKYINSGQNVSTVKRYIANYCSASVCAAAGLCSILPPYYWKNYFTALPAEVLAHHCQFISI